MEIDGGVAKDQIVAAASKILASMDSGFWSRGGHTESQLIIAIVTAALASNPNIPKQTQTDQTDQQGQ